MRRDVIILIVLFAGLVALIGGSSGQSEGTAWGSPSSHVSGPSGALALYRWAEDLGYATRRLEYEEFLGPAGMPPAFDSADLLLVLGPGERYSDAEAEAVRAWVEAGGTLVVAEDRPGPGAPAAPLLAAFDLAIAPAAAQQTSAETPVLQPALGLPPARRVIAPEARIVATEREDVVALAGTVAEPVLLGLQVGEGYVFASASSYIFTNGGLREEDNPAAVLNMLRRAPAGGVILFDEIHHGFVGQASLRDLLLETPWGWAALYGGLVGAGYLALTGRRFGRPVPLRAEAARRSSAEYLASMAGLLRRAGKGGYVQAHFRAGLKRRLARDAGLSPDLDDQALVAVIAQTRPARARAAAELLARMTSPTPDDKALLALVRDADRLLEEA